MRLRKRYFIKEQEWHTEWRPMSRNAAKVDWVDRLIVLDPSLKLKGNMGELEFILRHELLHILRGRPKDHREHQIPSMTHANFVNLSMKLDRLVHQGFDE